MAFDQSKRFVVEKLEVTSKGSIKFDADSEQFFAFRGFYGAFSDYTTQTIASTTSAYVMAIGQTDEAAGVSIVNGGKITVAEAGIYNIQWSGQFVNPMTADLDANVWMRKNNVDIVGSTGVVNVPAKHGTTSGHTIAGWNFVMSLAKNDYLELVWSGESTSLLLETSAASTNPIRPSTASLVVTVTQVR